MDETLAHQITMLINEDPTLEPHRATLEKLVPVLLAQREHAVIDDAFKAALKEKLAASPQLAQRKPALTPRAMLTRRISLIALVLVLMVASGATGAAVDRRYRTPGVVQYVNVTRPEVTALQANAFGSLDDSANVAQANTARATESRLGGAAGDQAAISSMPYYVGTQNVTVNFAGEIPVPAAQLPVYSYQAAEQDVMTSALTGMIAAGKLRSATSSTLMINLDDTTTLSYSSLDGYLSISRYSNLAAPLANREVFTAPASASPQPLTNSQKQQYLDTAARLLSEFGIGTSAFGSPVVQESMYQWTKDVSVHYPLTIDGREVIDQYSGRPAGITITGSPAAGLYSNQALDDTYFSIHVIIPRFARSDYATTQDITAIRDYVTNYARSMGGYLFAEADQAATSTTVTLGTPKLALTTSYGSNNLSAATSVSSFGLQRSYIVPAYVFPIEGKPGQNIVVPLTATIFDQLRYVYQNYSVQPMIDPAAASAPAPELKAAQ
jgi:hypothetical protein